MKIINKTCKGVVVRYQENQFFSNGTLCCNFKFRIMKKLSCNDLECKYCEKRLFKEELMHYGSDLPISFNKDELIHNNLYKLKFVPLSTDFETGYLDEWEWRIKKNG